MLNKRLAAALVIVAAAVMVAGCATEQQCLDMGFEKADEPIQIYPTTPIIILERKDTDDATLAFYKKEVELQVDDSVSIFPDCLLRNDLIGSSSKDCEYLPQENGTDHEVAKVIRLKNGSIKFEISCSKYGVKWWVRDENNSAHNCKYLTRGDIPENNKVPAEFGGIPSNQFKHWDGENEVDVREFKMLVVTPN